MERGASSSPVPPASPDPPTPRNPTPPRMPKPMGVNASDASGSDADTQEPVKQPVMVADSDDDAPHARRANGAAKMRRIMDRIQDVDSDRSADEDDDDDPLPADAAVDFGDEEEPEENEPKGRDAGVVTHVVEDVVDVDKEESGDDAGEDEQEQAEEQEPEEPVPKKKSSQTLLKKKPKEKKEKPAGPAKSIKKAASDGKAKGKTVKGKGTALVRKKDPSPKPRSATEKKPTSPKGSAKNSPRPSPTPSPKKKAARSPGKATGKAAGKAVSKAKAGAPEKGTKPKKTIVKKEKSDKREVKQEKKQVTKTFSKKSKSIAPKTPTKVKKSATVKKVKTVGKSTKTKKGKARPKSSEDDDEEDEAMVVDDQDSESKSEDASSDIEEEGVKTPAQKLPILGNLACSSRDDNCIALLDHAVEQLGKYNVVSYGADSECSLSAYIIGKGTKRGWGLLQALATGVPLVSDDWLSTSISEGKWKPIDMFRSDRFGQSPRSVDGDATAACSKLLEGVRVKVCCQGKDEASVRKMLRICGARVAETRIDVVINDTGKKTAGNTNVVKKWLADSIEAGMPLDYGAYVVA